MSFLGKRVGAVGEDIAMNFLKNKGFKIIARNFSTRYGEIDLIAQKENKLHFIEVKTRTSDNKGKPYEAINKRKVFHLKSAIQIYLLKNKNKDCKLSLDAISIWLGQGDSIKELLHFENVEL